jgi:hypothetical protein
MNKPAPEKVIKNSLWRRGDLSWKLRPHQIPIYRHIADSKASKTLLNISRQTGKSFVAVLYAVEHCLKTKNAHVQFLASTGKQMRTILQPALKKILDDCPPDIEPRSVATDGSWHFPTTGAVLRFDNDNAENLRGRSSTLVIIDEAGFVDDLQYLVTDIINPQFIVTKGRMVLISTPPETPDHYFKHLCDEAKLDDAYLERNVYQNGFASPEDIVQWMKEAGGENSTTWKREYLCQFLVDEARQVLPEFTDERIKKVVLDVPPAGSNHKVVAMDVGFRDATGILFAYYDFRSARLMIQNEVLIKGREVRTDLLAKTISSIEQSIWGCEPTFRVSDVDLILLNDLQSIHNLNFRPASKDFKEAMVNELRLWVQSDRIQIDPVCVKLIRQLQNCIWTKDRKQFERDAEGHYDLVDALIYLVRTLPSVIPLNPHTGLDPAVTPASHWISNRKKQEDPDVEAFEHLFEAPDESDDWVEFEQLIR